MNKILAMCVSNLIWNFNFSFITKSSRLSIKKSRRELLKLHGFFTRLLFKV